MNNEDKKQLAFLLALTKNELHDYLNNCDVETMLYSLMLIAQHNDAWTNKSIPRVKIRAKEDLSLARDYLKKFMLNKT